MVKKFENVKWEAVPLEGFPIKNDDFHGFVGLEECTNYGFEKGNKRTKQQKPQNKMHLQQKSQNKRKRPEITPIEVPNKKVKLCSGYVVEEICQRVTPTLGNEIPSNIKINGTKENSKMKKIIKPKLGENMNEIQSHLTPEDMLTWAEFKLPDEILKALAELGFKQPTKIQQLTLPAAIHGRRDILGAAETGSGKTLAFGLPILTGIMKLKEKAAAGLDVYEIEYKKSSTKKKNLPHTEDKTDNKGKNKSNNRKRIQNKKKAVASSEDDSSDNSNNESDDDNTAIDRSDEDKGVTLEKPTETNQNDESKEHDDFIEEYDVPLRKKTSDDIENTYEDDDDFIHLSEMLDSDDLADSSDDETQSHPKATAETNNDDTTTENDELAVDEVINDDGGIGCVKVIDNITIPGHVTVKTGKPLYALILTPTRELAIQISRHLISAAKYTGIRVATIVGGMATVKQERVLRCGPEVVVATPGRLWELLSAGQPHLQQMSTVKFLAIDETDRMVERNHFEELQPLLERLNADETRRAARQNFVFSATLTMVHDLPAHLRGKKVTKRGKILNRNIKKMTPEQKIKRLVKMIGMTDPKVVDITTQNLGAAATLTECRIACPAELKDAHLYHVLARHPGRAIVFCNSIGCVRRLAQLLTLLQCRPLPLHASMPQRQRLKNLERFRDDPHGVLVATDVAARGLDIPDVDHVIHYQVPRTAENYVHRSGRTARANKEGLTILMMDPSEGYRYAKLCQTLHKTAQLPTFPVGAGALGGVRAAVGAARELDSLLLRRRRAARALGWRERAARDMDIIVDDDYVPATEVDPSLEKAVQLKKKQLQSLLSKTMFPRGFSCKYPTLNDPDTLKVKHDNALQVMKNALESGSIKKEKRKGKNAEFLKLEKDFMNNNKKSANK